MYRSKTTMLKKTLLLFLFGLIVTIARAQIPDSLFNRLGDFDLARFNDNVREAIQIGEQILPDTAKLTAKVRVSFFARLARLYEDDDQDKKAVLYYEKVAAAVPDYYVVQRALGYLYDKSAGDIQSKLRESQSNDPTHAHLFAAYQNAVRKALPYLEKAQACDPSDETLDLIKTLYKNINDEHGLATLNSRLTVLAKSCIDILNDQ
jgi:hypothetical protein